ncbi:bacterial regulatory helix-turn-helix, lysR family protein [Paraburkholderia xenovorans LB400]|uniref:Transcriptional regulator, LysR family n=1 Tax=Paraburkholderia xenovorans (strain LB400) TaxID=266265 RepID=Q13GN9_PARXL|nr:LysR substrate-binding domain-containing protein [Paraburkholderia xenovorans]ABE36750.1 transcriptional regulator, LysR family [Paraburkholderia xenovorans LB400]AIP34932.1 bacterial regulatory helix-turn-helix, lysR family protein [Paraburkholderia xenovorans LB400]
MNDPLDPLPSLNALRAFEAASRHLNFRLAAGELGVTQGAVAQHVRGLESSIGLVLFERRPRALVLTENGRSYAASVRRAFDLLVEATQALRPQPLQLTISVTPTFAAKWLIPRLQDFTAAHPEIDLRIIATDRLSHFQTDAIDLAVRYGQPPFGVGLNAECLFESVLVAVGSPRLANELRSSGAARFFARYPLLHDAHNQWPPFLQEVLKQSAAIGEKNIRFNQTSLAIDAAMAGQGIALAPFAFVGRAIAMGGLSRIFDVELRTGSGFYVVTPRRLRHPGPVAAVRGWLLKQGREQMCD